MQTLGYVYAVSVDSFALDTHLALVHSDAELHSSAFGERGVSLADDPLHLDRTTHGLRSGRELREDVVSR